MKHPHADILRAIAEDKDTEIECLNKPDGRWFNCAFEWFVGRPSNIYRIKPKPFIVNGVECPRPVKERAVKQPFMELRAYNAERSAQTYKVYCFATDADLMCVFDAVVKPFESEGK